MPEIQSIVSELTNIQTTLWIIIVGLLELTQISQKLTIHKDDLEILTILVIQLKVMIVGTTNTTSGWLFSSLYKLDFSMPLSMFRFIFIFNRDGVDRLRKEAWSIPNAKSASSSAQCWNHSWQASPRCFPYTIATKVLPHAMRDTAVGIWFACIGQVSWGYTTPESRLASKARSQGLAISEFKVMQPV